METSANTSRGKQRLEIRLKSAGSELPERCVPLWLAGEAKPAEQKIVLGRSGESTAKEFFVSLLPAVWISRRAICLVWRNGEWLAWTESTNPNVVLVRRTGETCKLRRGEDLSVRLVDGDKIWISSPFVDVQDQVEILFQSEVNFQRDPVVRLLKPLDQFTFRKLLMLGWLLKVLRGKSESLKLHEQKKTKFRGMMLALEKGLERVGGDFLEADGPPKKPEEDYFTEERKYMFMHMIRLVSATVGTPTPLDQDKRWFAILVEAIGRLTDAEPQSGRLESKKFALLMGLPHMLVDLVRIRQREQSLQVLWEEFRDRIGIELEALKRHVKLQVEKLEKDRPERTHAAVNRTGFVLHGPEWSTSEQNLDENSLITVEKRHFSNMRSLSSFEACFSKRGNGLWELNCLKGVVRLNGLNIGQDLVVVMDGDHVSFGGGEAWVRVYHTATCFFERAPFGIHEELYTHASSLARWMRLGDPLSQQEGAELRKQVKLLDNRLQVTDHDYLGRVLAVIASGRQCSDMFRRIVLGKSPSQIFLSAQANWNGSSSVVSALLTCLRHMDAHEALALTQKGGSPWTSGLLRGLSWMIFALLLPIADELDALCSKFLN